MKRSTFAVFLLVWTASTIEAQQTAMPGTVAPSTTASQASGPTMEQTINFLNQVEAEYGHLTFRFATNPAETAVGFDVSQMGNCSLIFNGTVFNHDNSSSVQTALDLTRSDPLSLEITQEEQITPPTFDVGIKKAAVTRIPAGDNKIEGRTELSPGKWISALGAPFVTQLGVVVSRSTSSISYVIGSQWYSTLNSSAVSDVRQSFGSIDDNMRRYFPGLRDEDWPSNGFFFPGSGRFSDIGVGDAVLVNDEFLVEILPKNVSTQYFRFGRFQDHDIAVRYGKALIHAIAMCKAQQPAMLF